MARLCETRNMRRKHKSRMDCCHVSTFGFGFVCNIHCRKTYRCGGKLTSDSCCIGGFTVPMWFTDTVLTCVYAKPKKRLGKHNVAAHIFSLLLFILIYVCLHDARNYWNTLNRNRDFHIGDCLHSFVMQVQQRCIAFSCSTYVCNSRCSHIFK